MRIEEGEILHGRRACELNAASALLKASWSIEIKGERGPRGGEGEGPL